MTCDNYPFFFFFHFCVTFFSFCLFLYVSVHFCLFFSFLSILVYFCLFGILFVLVLVFAHVKRLSVFRMLFDFLHKHAFAACDILHVCHPISEWTLSRIPPVAHQSLNTPQPGFFVSQSELNGLLD